MRGARGSVARPDPKSGVSIAASGETKMFMEMMAAGLLQCPADRAASLVGMAYDAKTRNMAKSIAGDAPIRWIMPDTAVTQDWSPERLNINLSRDNKVIRVWCG